MGVVKQVKIKLTGQVSDDYNDRDYEIVLARLRVICAEFDLELEEELASVRRRID